jgi:hypothetical protein
MSVVEPVIVFAGDDIEARLVWSRLGGYGIEAELVDQHIGSLAPWHVTGGGAGAVKVVVAAVDLEKARDVLEGDDT